MESKSDAVAATLSQDDRDALRRAKQVLESPSLTMKLTGLLGTPIEKMIGKLPGFAAGKINDATQLALRKCLNIELRTLGKPPAPDADAHDKPSNLLHKLAVATTGAAGGAFGFVALPIELPVTTTLIFRSVCDIARSEGEDLTSVDTQLQCLAVLGMGGHADKQEEDAELGYFVVRGALAQAISKASSDIASKGIAAHGSAAVFKLVQTVASRFSVQVTEQMAAKSIPAIGAVLGATVNTLFIDHFQQMAQGHFTVRRLERKYGMEAVRAAYQAIEISPVH